MLEQNLFCPDCCLRKAYFKTFTVKNRRLIRKYGLRTNNYLIGVGYTSMMNNLTVACGLSVLKKKKNIIAEALIHPCRYEEGIIDNHFTEYRITRSEKLKDRIEQMGFEIGNYREE